MLIAPYHEIGVWLFGLFLFGLCAFPHADRPPVLERCIGLCPSRPRLPLLRLTVPETVAISSDQYWQAVDVLALMILSYHHAQHGRVEQPSDQSPTAG